ncbi:hypothetical protein IGI04_030184 [Brassica rapa subsp. trilocularis]|uniref:Uncharacterized protein n=1 Tax=Brassica rapa subsp. trilocularis TaxID=1813537 RepID=A0ABQ7LPY9_BRACM|nr:hypothetical protein IGI04_030184 [Brassica rapa subsp. trilocularis]
MSSNISCMQQLCIYRYYNLQHLNSGPASNIISNQVTFIIYSLNGGKHELSLLRSSGDSIEGYTRMHGLVSYRRFGRARSLRSDRALARAWSLRSDQAGRTLGRCVATERGAFSRCVTTFFELSSDVSFFLRKVFRKKESISKKYLSEKFSFSSSDVLNVNFVVTVFDPNNIQTCHIYLRHLHLRSVASIGKEQMDEVRAKLDVVDELFKKQVCSAEREVADTPLGTQVRKLETQVIQTGETIKRQEAFAREPGADKGKHHVNAIIDDDFWQVVRNKKLEEGDFEIQSSMSLGGSQWCRPMSMNSHRSTDHDEDRWTDYSSHRSKSSVKSTEYNASESDVDRHNTPPIDIQAPLTYRVRLPSIDNDYINALRPPPKPLANPPERKPNPLNQNQFKKNKNLKGEEYESEYETEYSESIDTPTFPSIDSNESTVTDDRNNTWADSGYHESFVVDIVITSPNEEHTEEYDEDYWKERAIEMSLQDERLSFQDERLETYKFTNTFPTSFDAVHSTSVDTHPRPAKQPLTSIDTHKGTSSIFAPQLKFRSRRIFSLQLEKSMKSNHLKNTSSTEITLRSIDATVSTSIDTTLNPNLSISKLNDYANIDYGFLTPDEFGIFRDPDGNARAMDGRILQVSREDIADILQVANRPDNLFSQQRGTPDVIQTDPNNHA